MNKIPTAEELMQSKNGDDYTHWEEIHDMMIDFAQAHVTAALKANHKLHMNSGSAATEKESINAYPLTNIK